MTFTIGPIPSDISMGECIDVEVTYTIYPGEPATRDDPGSGDDVDITALKPDITLLHGMREHIETRIIEYHDWDYDF